MLSTPRVALFGLSLLAFAWALTELKPQPQGLLIAFTLVSLGVDLWGAPRVKPITFLVVCSLTSLIGYLVGGSSLFTLADQWLFPTTERVMPISILLVGAGMGVGCFALTFFSVLKPSAYLDRARRAGTIALVLTAVFAYGLDELVR